MPRQDIWLLVDTKVTAPDLLQDICYILCSAVSIAAISSPDSPHVLPRETPPERLRPCLDVRLTFFLQLLFDEIPFFYRLQAFSFLFFYILPSLFFVQQIEIFSCKTDVSAAEFFPKVCTPGQKQPSVFIAPDSFVSRLSLRAREIPLAQLRPAPTFTYRH